MSEPPKEPPTAVRASVMRRVRKQGTAPELLLRSALHRRGVRYRLHWPVPGLPRRSIDVALTLAAAGWEPGRVWEHEDMEAVADRLADLWRRRRGR